MAASQSHLRALPTRWGETSLGPRGSTRRRVAAIAVLLSALGCAETRVVSYRPFFSGLPGAEMSGKVTPIPGLGADPTFVPNNQIVIEKDKGEKELIAKNGQHLMVHIYNAIEADDADIFVAQVLSEMTKREYAVRGRDPRAAFDIMKQRREDVVMLFHSMPAGEFTPGVFAEYVAQGVRRVQLTGLAARDLRWRGFDMVMEKGNWRLRWFVGD